MRDFDDVTTHFVYTTCPVHRRWINRQADFTELWGLWAEFVPFMQEKSRQKWEKWKKEKNFYTALMLLFFQNFSKLGENLTLKKLVL